MLRICAAMTVVLATFASFCAAASAKGSSRVTLQSPGLLKHAAAGERIRIAWSQDGPARLPIADSRVARTVVRSLGVYVTLRGRSGGPTVKALCLGPCPSPQSRASLLSNIGTESPR